MEEEIVRTRREVTETTEEDEDCQMFGAEQQGETDSTDSVERGRQLNRKTVTTTIRVTKRSTSRKRVKNKKQGDRDLLSPGTDEEDRLVSPPLTSTPLKTNGFHRDDDNDDNDGGLLQRKATKSRQQSQGCGKIGRIAFLEPDSPPSPRTKEYRIGSLLLGGKNDAPSRRSTTAIPANTPNSDATCRNCRDPERTVNVRIIGDDSIDDAETGSKIVSVTPASYEIEDFPVDLIVTHIAGDRSRQKSGRSSIADEEDKRVLLDSWTVQMNQVCRWSELRNDRNVEIDGISRLKVYKDAFSFEFSVLELGKKAQ